MSAIYEEVVLAWKGREYTVKPDFRMVQAIEARGVSIMGVVNKIHRGEPPASQIAAIVAHMLRSGGAEATPEEVYAVLTNASADEWMRVTTAMTIAFFPSEKKEGNSGAPANGADRTAETTTQTPT